MPKHEVVTILDASDPRRPPPRSWFSAGLERRRLTLGTRLGSIIVLCMLATTVFGVGYVLRQAQVDAETRAAAAAAERSDAIAEKIKAMVERSLGAVAGARDSLAALHLYDSDRHVADMLLKHLLDTDPIRYGAWTVWKPDAFDGRDKDFAGKMPSDHTGRYLTYWHQDGVTVAMDKVRGYDVADAALFRTPLDGAEAFLSEPYYLIPQSEQPIEVVSYVEPIVVARHSLGAIGIDVEVSPIQDAIAAIARPSDGNVTLVSHGGTVVATTRKELAGTSLAERGNGALAVAFARAEARGAMDEDIAGASGPILRSWRPVSFNSVRTPWYVVSDMPLGAFATDAPLNRVQGAAIVILGIVAAMLAIILLAVRGIVTRPLANIERFIRTLGEEGGDTTCRETARRDEIGSIARTLVAFKASEQEVVRLRRAEAAREAEFFAKRRAELHQFADQLARSVQAASHVVEETARLIMQRAKSVADTAVASADRTRVILDASGVADRSVGAVDEAAGALKASISSIVVEMSQARRIAGEAAEQAATSSAVTTELSRSASHIGEIVAMIGSIASRTNMLALNASIEAARAGEAGRGFAVVAQEVKALAAQTSEATGEIGRQIKAMQGTAQDAAAALTRIGGSVAEINEISASIGRAVGAQDEATARIGQSVDGAVAASRRVNAAIVDVDRATSQTGDAAAEMLTETARLADESGRLNDEVLGFIARIRAA